MPAKVFITIDTEEDFWDDYRSIDNTVNNIDRIPVVQELFDRYGAVPTYLVTYPVLVNDHAVRIIQKINERGRCEIGSHCHPWNTPPFEKEINSHNVILCNLPYDLQCRKINTLHEKMVERFGFSPRCFRAGRWGFGPTVAKCIHSLGYVIDTSVTPFWDWTGNHGPDFSEAPTFSYRFGPNDILTEDPDGCLLEVPPTIGFLQKNFERCARIRKMILESPFAKLRLLGVLAKLRILNLQWLTPELFNGSDMVSLSKTFIQKGHTFLNMTFHSVSLLPGRSGYIHDEYDFQRFLKDIEIFLQFAVDSGLEFSPLSKAWDEFKSVKK